MPVTAQTRWPRLLAEPQAAEYLSIGKTMLRLKGPEPRRLGKRVLYDIRDLDRWADRLADMPVDEPDEAAEAADVEKRIMERLERGLG